MGVFLRPVTYDDKKAGRKNTPQMFLYIYIYVITLFKSDGVKIRPSKKTAQKNRAYFYAPVYFVLYLIV